MDARLIRGLRWLAGEAPWRLLAAVIGVLGATVWQADLPLVGRIAIGAIAGTATEVLFSAVIAYRTRDLRERAVVDTGAAAATLRATRLFTQTYVEGFVGSVMLPASFLDVARGLRAQSMRFPFHEAVRRWSDVWRDFAAAAERFSASVGPHAALLDTAARRRVQRMMRTADNVLDSIGQMSDTLDEMAPYEQWHETEDERYAELVRDRRLAELAIATRLESIDGECVKLEEAARVYAVSVRHDRSDREGRRRRQRALEVAQLRARKILLDGAPVRHLETSTLPDAMDVDLRLIARRPDFDFTGDRPSEGWQHFSAQLENAGQRLEHLTWRERERLEARARELLDVVRERARLAGNMAGAIASDVDLIAQTRRRAPSDEAIVAQRTEAIATARARMFAALHELVAAVDELSRIEAPDISRATSA